jgi:phage-related protein
VWGLHPGDNRWFGFLYHDHKFVLLYAYRKQSDKTPEMEIATAVRKMKEISEE